MTDEPSGDLPRADEIRPMSQERLQQLEMQASIRVAEARASTGRSGQGSKAEDLARMAREQLGLDPTTEMVRRRLAEDPELQSRLGEIRAAIGSDDPLGPEITPEGLPAFLRERA
jgi:hypothetical protein